MLTTKQLEAHKKLHEYGGKVFDIPKGRRRRGEEGQWISDSMLKHLEELGLIKVVTVSESPWRYSGEESKGNYYRIKLTNISFRLHKGEIKPEEIEKPCWLEISDNAYWHGICPRHGKRHEKVS